MIYFQTETTDKKQHINYYDREIRSQRVRRVLLDEAQLLERGPRGVRLGLLLVRDCDRGLVRHAVHHGLEGNNNETNVLEPPGFEFTVLKPILMVQ